MTRLTGAAAATIAALTTAVLVAAGALNPWHYLVVDRFVDAEFVIVGLAVAVALLYTAGYLWGWPMEGPVANVLVAVIGVGLLASYGLVRVADAVADDTDRPVRLALSADGRYEAVERTIRAGSDHLCREVRLRSRAGIRSRESARPVAVLWYPKPDPPRAARVPTVTATRFRGRRALEFTTSDGRTWTVTFDPRTLAADRALGRCGSAGCLCWRHT